MVVHLNGSGAFYWEVEKEGPMCARNVTEFLWFSSSGFCMVEAIVGEQSMYPLGEVMDHMRRGLLVSLKGCSERWVSWYGRLRSS